METTQADNEWQEVGGYDQHIIRENGKIKEITCTCMWGTMEISRFKEYKYRRPCKHILKILEEVRNVNEK